MQRNDHLNLNIYIYLKVNAEIKSYLLIIVAFLNTTKLKS